MASNPTNARGTGRCSPRRSRSEHPTSAERRRPRPARTRVRRSGGGLVADGREAFETDWRQRLLAERLLIIIGEAGRNLSDEFVAAHPALAVIGARGMRNFLVHQYDDVDPELVWDAITTSVPEFVRALTAQPDTDLAAPAADLGGVDV